MTNGKTTITFDHDVASGLKASIDILALTAVWLSDDSELRTKICAEIENLKGILRSEKNRQQGTIKFDNMDM